MPEVYHTLFSHYKTFYFILHFLLEALFFFVCLLVLVRGESFQAQDVSALQSGLGHDWMPKEEDSEELNTMENG